MDKIEVQLRLLEEKYPLVPHTGAGRLYSTVRRMKAEKEYGIPIKHRTGFAVSVKFGKHANELNEQEWEEFFSEMCGELEQHYPDMYKRLFS